MFEQVLPGNTKVTLALLEQEEAMQQAYLAGGTALALQLGHRISYDLDFFTQEAFDETKLLAKMEKMDTFVLEETSWRTLLGHFAGVRFSIFYYEYPLLANPKKFGKVNVVDLPDIAAMKVAAIGSRGTKRDFVDLYAICQEGFSLDECIKLYDKKFKNLASMAPHILKSLVFFDEADKNTMPDMLKKINWKDVKKFFEHHVKKIANRFF